MSTQSTPSILFTHSNPQQGFRLLELPPELVDLISSGDAPTLELKSPQPASDTNVSDACDSVNLCTPTKTYQIRQVQSSNSLHVLRPSNGRNAMRDNQTDAMDMDLGAENSNGSITSISKCGSTLELHTPKDDFSAEPYLVKMVGVYHDDENNEDENDVEMQDDDEDGGQAKEREIRNSVFADIPVSRAQCEQAWVDLCVFVQRRQSGPGSAAAATFCKRPSAEYAVSSVWKRVMEAAVLQGINLEKQFLANDLWRSMLDDNGDEPFPRALFEAVLRRVCELDATQLLSELKWASIDKTRCIQWVGSTYLEAKAPNSGSALGRSEFLKAWKNYLPEAWTAEVALSKLPEGSYQNPDPTTICFNRDMKKKDSSTANASTTAKKTRNWHELFKNQRRR